MQVFLTGGTGFVGSYLSKELLRQGHEVSILTRRESPAPRRCPASVTSPATPPRKGPGWGAVPEHDWIINLAGASIFNRWTEAYKQEIYDSRIRATQTW